MARIPKTRRHAVHWMCCALVVLMGMTRQLVICKHDDGPAHLEFAHPEGAAHHHGGCCHDHVHVVFAAQTEDDGCTECVAPHASCDHVHLSVDVGPRPAPSLLGAQGFELAPLWSPPAPKAHRRWLLSAARPTPGTGPPDPAPPPWLAQRASVVLLI